MVVAKSNRSSLVVTTALGLYAQLPLDDRLVSQRSRYTGFLLCQLTHFLISSNIGHQRHAHLLHINFTDRGAYARGGGQGGLAPMAA